MLNKRVDLNTESNKRAEADRVMRKYPDRIPVIVTKALYANKDLPHIDKNKYLAPIDLTMGQFQYVIRKRLHLSPDKALFMFVNNEVHCTSDLLASVYNTSHDKIDGFLHITYSGENTFGATF